MENEVVTISEINGKDEKNTVEARAVLGSDGRNELEEEVFEEAVEEYLQEQGMKYDIRGDPVVGQERKLEATDDFFAGADDIPSVGDKVDKFEEANGVSRKDGEAEEEIAPAAEVTNGVCDVDVSSFTRIDDWTSEKDVIDNVNVEQLSTDEDAHNKVDKVDKFEEANGVSRKDGEAEEEIAPAAEVTNGVCDVDVSSFTRIDDWTSEKDVIDNVNVEQLSTDEDAHNKVDKVDFHSETLSNKDVSNIASNSPKAYPNTFCAEDKGGVIELQKDTGHEDHNNNKWNDVTSGIDSIYRDHNGTELRDIYIITEQKDHDIKEVKDFSVDPFIIEKPEMVLSTAAELKAVDDTSYQARVAESAREVCMSAAAIDEQVKKEQEEKQISQVKEEQEEKQSAQVKEEQEEKQSTQVKGEQEEKQCAQVIKEQEEKQSTQASREQETQPAWQPASSSGKSPNLAPPPTCPAGLGRGASLLEPGPRVVQQPRLHGSAPQVQNQQIEEPVNGDPEESDETREKLQMIRVKFLRLAHRLGQTPHNVVVAQVLYRLGLAEQLRGRNGGRVGAFSFDRASAMAEQLEAAGDEPLDFSCTIMVLGKTGVGKSATINSIFDEMKFNTDAFQTGTKKVQDVVGTVQGIKIRVIDTPGLFSSWADQRQNEKLLRSVKRFIKKTPPDIVLYLDRLDMQNRDFIDMPLLRNITDIFGPSIWFNAIVVLTHAASAPPEGPNGTTSSYDMFVTQRSHVVQQAIRQAAGDMRLMNPVSLVENHSACRTNRAGQRVLPNGQVWKPHLLLLSFASKILAEANALLKLQDTSPGKPYTTRSRAPPLPFLLSSLLQSRPQLKLPEEQFGDNDSLDDDLDESSDSDDESEFDELPPFRHLTKAQVEKLSKAQKKAYFEELEYREKLFMKKQLKEEKKQRKLLKNMADSVKDLPSEYKESTEEEGAGAASVPVPMPDLALPASFDSDNPTHRFRYLDSSNQWLVRPVLETHGWDHDIGYEGINVERLFVVKNKMPLSFSGQITKDKKDANVQMEVASSIKHGQNKATSLGFDMQTVGKDLAYTLRSETRFSNFWRNKVAAGVSVTQMGDALSAGVKVEDKLIANKRFRLVMTGGAMTGRGDVAYGGSLEAQLRDKDYPLGRSLSTLGLSVMDWHGDLAIGCNIQSQIPVGRNTNLVARANLNNRGAGQVSIRLNSSEQLQIALMGLIPLLRKLHGYSLQLQYGQ